MEHFLTVGQQVLILFILIFVGFFLGKRGILKAEGARVLSDIALFLATPCVIIKACQRPFSWEMLLQLGLALLVSGAIHGVGIGIAALLYRKKSPRNLVLRLAAVMSNAGFMALPLQQAVLGENGVFYGTAYVVMFNLVLWTYGVITMDGSGRGLSWEKAVFNPGTVGVALGIAVFCLPFDLPEIISAPVSYLAALNTPLPMLFIGYCLSGVRFRPALGQIHFYFSVAVRLLLVPLVCIGLMYLLGLWGDLFLSMAIACCAPVAAGVPMFTTRFRGDTETAANLVALSTLASLLTMPLLVALCQMLP